MGGLIIKFIENIKIPSFEYAIYLKDLVNGEVFIDKDGDRIFKSASMIKLPILYAFFVLKGKDFLKDKIKISSSDRVEWSVITDLSQDEYSLNDILTLMITQSDNTATNIMIDYLGMDEINRVIREEGLRNTKLKRKMMDIDSVKKGIDNFTSLHDLAILFKKIYLKQNEMLEILKKQRDNESLKRFLDEDIIVAHKTGSLFGLNHDMGIFRLDEHPYILGVFTSDAENNYETKDFIGKVGRAVYENDYFKL